MRHRAGSGAEECDRSGVPAATAWLSPGPVPPQRSWLPPSVPWGSCLATRLLSIIICCGEAVVNRSASRCRTCKVRLKCLSWKHERTVEPVEVWSMPSPFPGMGSVSGNPGNLARLLSCIGQRDHHAIASGNSSRGSLMGLSKQGTRSPPDQCGVGSPGGAFGPGKPQLGL